MNNFDLEYLKQNVDSSDLMASDSALGNILLLQPKYNTELIINNNIFYRKYTGKKSRTGYAFPLSLKKSEKQFDYLKDAINFIFQQNQNKNDINFCLCTQEQKNAIDECLLKNFSDYKVLWDTNRDDCDYIYLQEKLSVLSGSSLQKKKNHISRFKRAYENNFDFKLYPENDIAKDILQVEEDWYNERSNDVEKSFDDNALTLEKDSIKFALENTELLQITGAVLYVNERPCAMCLASPISEQTIDIHFEKCLSFCAENGGYAVINNFFVKSLSSYKYINREEDMGVEGLRKAKLSYKPEILLNKFYGKVVKC